MKYICAALVAVIILLGWLYIQTDSDLSLTRQTLAVAFEANEHNKKTIARLEHNADVTDRVLTGWNDDRTALATVRSATRAAIKEAMRDETFKTWALSAVPPDAQRLLREPAHSGRNGTGVSPFPPDARLP